MKINFLNFYNIKNQLNNNQKTTLSSVKNFNITLQKSNDSFTLQNLNFRSRKFDKTNSKQTISQTDKSKEQTNNGVYIAYQNRSFKRFNSMYEAMDYTDVCRKEKGLNNPIIIKAKFVESVNSKGDLIVDREKLMEIIDNQRLKNAFFLFDKNGVCKYFLSREKLEEYILKRQQEEQFKLGIDFIFEKGAKVPFKSSDGKISIKKEYREKILNILNKSSNPKSSTSLDNRIYMIRKDMTFEVFNSTNEAAIALNINENNIKRSLRGICSPKINAAFVYACDVEYKDENGVSHPDLDKIDRLSKGVDDRSFYLIAKLGFFKKFENIKEAALFLNIDPINVLRALSGATHSTKGYIIKEANEVEKVVKRGVVEVDTDKILEYAKEIDNDYCVISDDRDFQIFTRLIDAKKYKQEKLSQNKKAQVVPASLLKTLTQEGEIVFDTKKIEEYLKNSTDAIYVIDYKGAYKKFPSIKEAALYIGCKESYIQDILNGKTLSLKGFTVAPAYIPEYYKEDKTLSVNRELIERYREKIDKSLYVIKEDGSYKKVNSPKEAAQFIGCQTQNVRSLLRNERLTTSSASIINARFVERIDEKGNITIDKSAIDERIKEMISAKERKSKFLKKPK